jgi:hypothetical protein
VLNTDRCLSVFNVVESHKDHLRSQPRPDLSSPSTPIFGKNSASSSPLADVRPSRRNLRAPPRNGSTAARSSTESVHAGERTHGSTTATCALAGSPQSCRSASLSPTRRHGEMRMRSSFRVRRGDETDTRFCLSESCTLPLIGNERLTRVWARFGPGGRRENWPRPSPCFTSQRADRARPELVAGPFLA